MRCRMLMSVVLGAVVLANSSMAPANAAMRRCPHGGYCLPGTCVKFNPGAARLQYACNVKNCSAANCPR